MTNPLISIIIPTYNRAHLIGETLDSILAQTYENWECIIVDDGSSDNTDEVVKAYANKDKRFQHHLRPSTHKSAGNGARNYGFELSKGEYINWFDSDDLMLPNFLEFKIKLFTPSIDLVITSGYYVASDLSNQVKIELFPTDWLYKDFIMWKLKIFTFSVMIRKSFLANNHFYFNEDIIRGQETEFFSRIFFGLKKHQFVISNSATFLYRQHEETKSFQNKNYRPEFKQSQAYIAVANFKRSIQACDTELIQFFYKRNLNLFFESLRHFDNKNAKYILNAFTPILIKKRFFIGICFTFFGSILCFINQSNSYVERFFKSFKL